ncbi:hypothetical protein BGX29_002857 [Mortierella sp. GBA35]|nr:hypothetical protein BGX29_002857 [Mortierella sp. GBA35]
MVTATSAIALSLVSSLFALANAATVKTTANCVIQLPRNPLSAEGLASAFLLSRGSCDQRDPNQRVFVEATVFGPSDKSFAVYHPLVINEGTQPAMQPTAPALPKDAVVVLHFSTRAHSLTLAGDTQTCSGVSLQSAACNAASFFNAARSVESVEGDISAACAASQELGASVFTTYLESAYGEFAQATQKNREALAEYLQLADTSPPQCSSWLARSLMEENTLLPSKALYNLQASSSKRARQVSTGLHRQFKRDRHLKGCSNRVQLGNKTVPGTDLCVAILSGESDEQTLVTEWGPLTAADRELVRKVKLASLWELPIASEAIDRSKNKRVSKISKKIAEQHQFLDATVLAVSKQLDIRLPKGPSSEQACWMCEIRAALTDEEYNNNFVRRLRFAHGQIFGFIGLVRSTTRNSVIRSFAETANLFVLGHMQMLESTGLTNTTSFPASPPIALFL